MNDLNLTNFDTTARSVLAFLHKRLGFDLWMVTRLEGDDWIVLQSVDHGYLLNEGTTFSWADSLCAQMVKGNGPRIAPDTNDVPAYASAPIAAKLKIGSYIGVPLKGLDGELFGTMCAIHPTSQPSTLKKEEDLVTMMGGLLSSLLQTQMQFASEMRRAERAQAEALSDAMTGLFNRRGWSQLLTGEENRCRRHGHPASIIAIDIDNLKNVNDTRGHFEGDELIARTGKVLVDVARSQDVVARVGGDEFAILAVECDRAGNDIFIMRLREALDKAGIKASIGYALRDPTKELQDAWEEADEAMYAEKKKRAARIDHSLPLGASN